MHWYNPDAPTADADKVPGCGEDPIVMAASGVALHYLLYGAHRRSQGEHRRAMPSVRRLRAAAPQLTRTISPTGRW